MTDEIDRRCTSGVAQVDRLLGRLGLKPTTVLRGGIAHRAIPEGDGWCQALGVPEEGWPPGALLCVIVRWYPDKAYRRTGHTVPVGAEAHWKDRVAAVVAGLRSAGFMAAVTGPPRAPRLHPSEDILVWRMAPDQSAEEWPPFGAWDGAEPARPNWDHPEYRYPERDPLTLVDAALSSARRRRRAEEVPEAGSVRVLTVRAVVWPPFAEMCARVLWHPDPRFRRLWDGTLPSWAEEHWEVGVGRVRKDLEEAGYRVRESPRRLPSELDEHAGLLVWRGRL